MRVIKGPYLQDLLSQPKALEATHAWLAERGRWSVVSEFLSAHRARRIVLTGMGSSFHSLHPLNIALIDAGFTPILMETSELIHYGRALIDEQTLIIAVSQSGRSAETLRLIEVSKHASLLAVTNTQDSPLAHASRCALISQAGPEATVSCKTYVTGLMILQWLGAIVAGRSEADTVQMLRQAASCLDEYLNHWREHCEALADKLRGTRHLFLAGRGDSLAAVGTGALIIKESAHCHAEGMSSAAFRHGPMEMLQPHMRTVVFSGAVPTRELNRQLLRDLTEKGGVCDEIGEEATYAPFRLPNVDAQLRPLLEILPIQMMTLALAALASREAGRFEHATKITATE
jgi:glucosamine--fructose-6-phosphate aminotransferase (isomerizing)